jgi:broad specificity phosphatase PhoE
MELILIRHGQSEGNVGLSDDPDCDLTPAGCEQARQVAEELASIDLTGFAGIVSPYRRARRTAAAITARTGLSFAVDPRIREWGRQCEIDGNAYCEETRAQLVDRIAQFLENTPGRRLVLVAHAAPLAVIMKIVQGEPLDLDGQFWLGVENCRIYRMTGGHESIE